jgi:hypothetical protein
MVDERTSGERGRIGGLRPRRALSRRARLLLGTSLLGVSAVAAIAGIPVTTTYADDQPTAFDQQAYVPDSGADQYQADALSGGGCSASQCPAPDPNAIHVGAAPNQSTYHSLLHLELDQFKGQTVSAIVVKLSVLTPATTPQDNVNTSAALLDAYPLTTKMDPAFQGCTTSAQCPAPSFDTNGPKVVGKFAETDSSGNPTAVTFDVGPMLKYWQAKGVNTGFAVVPDAGATTTPWDISFDRTQATATVTLQSTTSSSSPATSQPTAPLSSGSSSTFNGGGGGSVSIPVTVPTVAPAVSPAATPKPSSSHAPAPAATVPATTGGGGNPANGVPLWLVILGISLAASVALLAQPVSQALSTSGGLRIGLMRELKIHPRMFAVAATLLVWSSAWGVYSGATGAGQLNAGSHGPVASANNGSSSLPNYAPDLGSSASASAAPGSTASGSSGGGSSSGGGGGTINGAPVGAAAFTGAANAPNAPAAQLYTGADNTVGITDTTIQMCAHAALTFGPAFNIGAADLNVFWQMVNNPATDPYPHTAGQGGIYNRKIVQPGGSDGIAIQDDGYQPSKAIQAAQACQQQSGGDFFLLSGIGFDQIPVVRVWAEQNHMIYIHHIATQAGTAGLQYSFTMLPTLEQIGTQYAQYYLTHLKGQKIGIIKRQSSNWEPGVTAFKNALAAAGVPSTTIVKEDPVSNNQGDYSKEIVDMQTNGAQTVFVWENALAADSIIQQAGNQNYTPKWLLFPFNLTLYTLNQSSSNAAEIQGMQGLVPWPAYTSSSARCKSGGSGITRTDSDYAQYSKEIQQFEAAYASLDPGANMCGDGGDLLFASWEAWKQVADLLVQCGPNCDRNKIAGLMLNGYKSTVGANCPVDFSVGDHHHGGTGGEDVYATKPENGGPGWVNTGYCEATIR